MNTYIVKKILFLSLLWQILSACTPINTYIAPKFSKHIDAPQGSYIKKQADVQKTSKKHHYVIYLSNNTGGRRKNIEKSYMNIPLNSHNLSFTLSSNENLIVLKTPITLIEILDHNNKAILSLKQQKNIYWIEIANQKKQVSLFLDQEPNNFQIIQNDKQLSFNFNDDHFDIIKKSFGYSVNIGLTRYDLQRYNGLYIPDQKLHIKFIEDD